MNKNLDLNPVRCRCGGEAETIVIHRTDGRIVYFVKCVDCGIETPEFYVEAEAVTVWNRAMGTDRCCNTCDIYEDDVTASFGVFSAEVTIGVKIGVKKMTESEWWESLKDAQEMDEREWLEKWGKQKDEIVDFWKEK